MSRYSFPDEVFADLGVKNPKQLYLISLGSRPGFVEFAQDLEHSHFGPTSPNAALFQIYMCTWPISAPLTWIVLQIPLSYRSIVDELAAKHRMRLADGIPHLVTHEGVTSFPIKDSPNIFTIENTSQNTPQRGGQ